MKTPIREVVSENLGTIRKSRGMTLKRLAKLSGIPISTLSTLESGKVNPSLEVVVRLTEVLGLTLEELISVPAIDVQVVRGKEMPVSKQIHGAGKLTRLIPDPFPGMDLYYLELNGRGIFPGTKHGAHSWRYLFCVSGSIRLHIGGQESRIGEGDAVLFPGDLIHSYQSIATRSSALVVKGYGKQKMQSSSFSIS